VVAKAQRPTRGGFFALLPLNPRRLCPNFCNFLCYALQQRVLDAYGEVLSLGVGGLPSPRISPAAGLPGLLLWPLGKGEMKHQYALKGITTAIDDKKTRMQKKGETRNTQQDTLIQLEAALSWHLAGDNQKCLLD
jgi:hypothetical protein